jgi:site-specific DNA-methyltransferase (adenine-specific)
MIEGDLEALAISRHPALKQIEESVDLVVTSPPYKRKDGFSESLMETMGTVLRYSLKPGGRVFFNFGQLREGLWRPYEAAELVWKWGFMSPGQTIAWVKSVVIDGAQRGHYQPIGGGKLLNYCWEPIFTFYKEPEPDLDRLSVGVPFADKSNMKRGTRGKHGDLHCAGDVWFLPYKTTGAKAKKKHSYEFPEELVERCVKVAGLEPGSTVLDPFCGSGTTLSVAKRLGHHAIGIEKDSETAEAARDRWAGA